MSDFLLLAFIFLVAGVIAVPVASRLGLGSVLGYLLAGIVIAPILAFLNVDVVSLQHFAEFGVVMMLFLVGLELQPQTLWQMRARLLGLGGLQVGGTTGLITAGVMILGQPWQMALAIGLIFALSSTAIVLQSLGEKGLLKSDGGQASFSVLLFQDIAVIPMLALLPLLAMPDLVDLSAPGDIAAPAPEQTEAHGDGHSDGHSDEHDDGHGDGHSDGHSDGHDDDHGGGVPNLTENLPGWLAALVTLGAIAAVILGGTVATRPVFRYISMANLRELFTAAALLLVIGIALLMTLVGLSPALGTFLAGVVLANSEYRHELESDIEPFKGLLLGLFFMTVGAAIDFDVLFGNFFTLLALTLMLIAIKGGVLYALGRLFRVPGSNLWLFTLALAQAGEFGFVLLSFAVSNAILPPDLSDRLVLVVTLSMLLTPALFIVFERVIAPRFIDEQSKEPDEIDQTGRIIVAGHGRFGGIVNRMLLANGYHTVVLDYSSSTLEMLRTFGIKVFFGDATRPDLLHTAGAEDAELIVIALDGRDQITQMVHHVTKTYPHLKIVARAVDRPHVYELYAAGAREIIRETFDSGVRAGRTAMEVLGMHPYDAERRAKTFERLDRKMIAEMAEVYDPEVPIERNPAYVARAKAFREQQEAELRGTDPAFSNRADRGWSPPTLTDVEAVTEAAVSEANDDTGGLERPVD